MLGASLVCFQTYSYARHFSSSCIRVCGYESAPTGIDVKGVLTTVKHCAVGIDAERVEKDTLRPGILPKMEALRSLYQGKKIVVARDKLDVVKGILQKLHAFEKLLQDYPEWRGRVRFGLCAALSVPLTLFIRPASGCYDPGYVSCTFRFPQIRTTSFGAGCAHQWRIWIT